MNTKDLPEIYSTAFWCQFVVLLFFWLYCVTTVTPFIERSESWSLRSVGVLDQSQQQCRFFRRNSNPLQTFQLHPKRETSSSSLEDELEKRSIISPFVPDFVASLAFVQSLSTLLRLPTNLHYDNYHLHDGCQVGNDTSTRLSQCEKASACAINTCYVNDCLRLT